MKLYRFKQIFIQQTNWISITLPAVGKVCECFQKQTNKQKNQSTTRVPKQVLLCTSDCWAIALYNGYTLISLERLSEHPMYIWYTELDITVYHIRHVFNKIVSTIFLTHSFYSREKIWTLLPLSFPKYRVICSTKQRPPPIQTELRNKWPVASGWVTHVHTVQEAAPAPPPAPGGHLPDFRASALSHPPDDSPSNWTKKRATFTVTPGSKPILSQTQRVICRKIHRCS